MEFAKEAYPEFPKTMAWVKQNTKACLSVLALFILSLLAQPEKTLASNVDKGEDLIHCVSSGESLNRIARQYLHLTDAMSTGELIEQIKALNGIQSSLIRPDQRLLIPLSRTTRTKTEIVPKEPGFQAKGIYINRYSMACNKMRRLVETLIACGGNTVILDGKDMTGKLSYPSRISLVKEIGSDRGAVINNPAKLFHYLHQKGLHVSVRLVLFYDPFLANGRPELALCAKDNGNDNRELQKGLWVDPAHPAVQDYNLGIARELAQMGVDEIQFDYIRYPTGEGFQDSADSIDKHSVPRDRIISDFLARAYEELAPHKVLLSIDVFGIIAWGRREDISVIGQRIEALAEHCDVICPMIYPSHFTSPFQDITNPGREPFLMVSKTCQLFSSFLNGSGTTLRPWIQAFPLRAGNFTEDYILEELRALDQSDSIGWMLWSAGNSYDVAWRALERWNRRPLEGVAASAGSFYYY
ncbi:MAG: LysM peptidoglycan-binding domain-containing protein [Deltaproteobacteria bacterium]|nr:MAG: LysM peptidoglycan-binding domain-containing protein [Deltaproteobacteria bacterium]